MIVICQFCLLSVSPSTERCPRCGAPVAEADELPAEGQVSQISTANGAASRQPDVTAWQRITQAGALFMHGARAAPALGRADATKTTATRLSEPR